MKFKEYLKEEEMNKTTVMAFGRMNPPTVGHAKLVDKVHAVAKEHKADHLVVLSHSQDADKNPLTPQQKLKHAKRFFPKTNIDVASKENPSFLTHAKKLHDSGTKHLVMVAGSDRAEEYHKILHRYNGPTDKHMFNFKSIKVVSAGERDPDAEGVEGMSASKMRAHAKNGSFNEFKKGVPSHVKPHHVEELYNDVLSGMKSKPKTVREQYLNGEIFNVGDVVVDNESNIMEIVGRGNNFVIVEGAAFAGGMKRWLKDIEPARRDPPKQPDILIANGEKSLEDLNGIRRRKISFKKTQYTESTHKEVPRLLMTKEQIEEAQGGSGQIEYDGYCTQNFDVEPRAKKMFEKLIALVPPPDQESQTHNPTATDAQVGALVKPMGFRHQQTKHYLNI